MMVKLPGASSLFGGDRSLQLFPNLDHWPSRFYPDDHYHDDDGGDDDDGGGGDLYKMIKRRA